MKKNKYISNKNINNIIDKWVNKYKFAVDFKNKRNLSIAFEYLEIILEKETYGVKILDIKLISFPIVRRIFERITDEKDLEIKKIKKYVDNILDYIIYFKVDISDEISNTIGSHNIDIEYMLCNSICDTFCDDFETK